MAALVVTWIEVSKYVDDLLKVETGNRLVLAKALKYLVFKSFVKTLMPEERGLMKMLENELSNKTDRKKGGKEKSKAGAV